MTSSRRLALAVAAAMATACSPSGPKPGPEDPPSAAPAYGYEIVREYPHDPEAFTQGLIYRDGFLYESTGQLGRSTLRKVRLEDGEVLQQRRVGDRFFAEGLTDWGDRLLQLTPMRSVGDVADTLSQIGESSFFAAIGRRFGVNVGASYDIATFEPQATFSYNGEGWGLSHDSRRLILSDGTSELRFLDPDTFTELGSLEVTDQGRSVDRLNELELVAGAIYANVWFQHRIAIIHPDSGRVAGWIDLAGLASRMTPPPDESAGAVLNGIAYDADGRRLFVTGKRWSRLFEIRLRQ